MIQPALQTVAEHADFSQLSHVEPAATSPGVTADPVVVDFVVTIPESIRVAITLKREEGIRATLELEEMGVVEDIKQAAVEASPGFEWRQVRAE